MSSMLWSMMASVRLMIQWSAGAVGLFDLECRLESSRSSVRLLTWLLVTGPLHTRKSDLEHGHPLVHFC